MKNPLARISLHRQFLVVQEITILLGLFEFIALPLAAFFIGTKEIENSVILLIATGISYYISSKLGILTSRLLIRLEIEDARKREEERKNESN
jgi:hypothetical protein